MDGNGWKPPPAQGDPVMTSGDWRSELSGESRQRIVNKIMETLKKHLPISGPEGVAELNKIAVRFEEKIYTAATSQTDYLRRISLKMLTMESKSTNTSSFSSNPAAGGQNPPEQALQSMHQTRNQGQSLPIPLPNQAQGRQQMLTQRIQNPMPSTSVQGASSLPPALSSVSGTAQTGLSSGVSQSSTLQSMSGISQNSVNNSIGQTVPQNMFSTPQRQIQGRQQLQQQVATQQHQQQTHNQQHILYQQQLLKQKMQQQGTIQQSLLQQSHMPQQQSMLQPNQLQPAQQSLMSTSQQPSVQPNQPFLQQSQTSGIQTAQPSSLQHSQQTSLQQSVSSVTQQHQPSVLRPQQQSQQSNVPQQPSVVHQQQPQMGQPTMIPPQQQQQLMSQMSSSSMQQNHILGQQSGTPDIQQQQQQQQHQLQQQQQRMLNQTNLSNVQQQQQLLGQQINIPNIHQQPQQLTQGSVSGMQQQQQLLGLQSNISNVSQHSHPIHQLLQQGKSSVQHQQPQQGSSVLLQQPAPQPQSQASQQQLMSQLQSQSTQMQQQNTLQQQSSLQREFQQRIQSSGSLLQPQGVAEQQKPMFQPQRGLADASSTPMDPTTQIAHSAAGDWQEDAFQKLQALKDLYFNELNDLYQKLTLKCQQQNALLQTAMQSEQFEKLKSYRNAVKSALAYLSVAKSSITPSFKDKIGMIEKQILYIINLFKGRKTVASNQQGQQQLPPQTGGQSQHAQQQQQPPAQISQLQQHESHTNQLQSMNIQNSATSMQSNSVTTMQHGGMPLGQHIGVASSQPNLRNMLQPGSHLDTTNSLGSLQQSAISSLSQGGAGSLSQNTLNTTQQTGRSSLPQSSMSTLPQTSAGSLQSTASMIQHQQQLKQLQQRQLLMQQHKQQMGSQTQLQQQFQQQQLQVHQKQLQAAQLQTHQLTQLQQLSDVNELKMKPGVSLKPGLLQQQHTIGQRQVYQQLKAGSSLPVSSPQLLATSPQISQHSSPQVDQQSLLTVTSLPKVGTPLQAANSPFVVPSPATPLAPSPLPGDSEKPGASPLSNTGNFINQQPTVLLAQQQSLAIGTPGISASPLLAEFSIQDGNQGGSAAALGSNSKSTTHERPLDRLIKAVTSVSSKAFSSSIGDISSVVNLIDRMAGSAPGNGSRAAVGEDLVATTRCRLQARSFIAQDGSAATRKMKRSTSAMPLNTVSSAGSVNNSVRQLSVESSELESTATSGVKRPRTKVNPILLEEIKETNQKLIDTVVDLSDEDSDMTATAAEGRDGIVVKCSYNAVALSPNMKSQYALAQKSPILPLRLLVPSNYPKCSPVLLDIPPVEVSEEGEDLSSKAKSKFILSVRGLPQPMSLGDMVRMWDVCARQVMTEYAQRSGGGSFSSSYGTWESCVSA